MIHPGNDLGSKQNSQHNDKERQGDVYGAGEEVGASDLFKIDFCDKTEFSESVDTLQLKLRDLRHQFAFGTGLKWFHKGNVRAGDIIWLIGTMRFKRRKGLQLRILT